MKEHKSGLIIVNKPVGVSSQYVVTGVKRALKAKKAGHTGTLDQMASGVLPVCLGEATKYADFLVGASKSYEVKVLFGYRSSTGDMEGFCTAYNQKIFDLQQMLEVILDFTGEIKQVPPMYSAIKHQGMPLYKYARQGRAIERAARPVTINEIKVLNFTWPWVTLLIDCSKGTYIRTLVEDIASALGTYAYVVGLHRTRVAKFDTSFMQDFAVIKQGVADIFPVEKMLDGLKKVILEKEFEIIFIQGRVLETIELDGLVAVFGVSHGFIGLGEVKDGRLRPKRLMSFNR